MAPYNWGNSRKLSKEYNVLGNAWTQIIPFYPGKGAAYARAEQELVRLTSLLNIPVLPSPMAKGILPDDSQLVVSAARSKVLGTQRSLLISLKGVIW